MSVSVEQLLADAKRLSSRLRDHDLSADSLMTSANDVLKDVEAMRQYQEDLEQLNEVAHNRPRAQLVLGIQQENRHIRQLQQENKELRAALEEHQNAVELIMSKYRQHMSYLVNTTKLDKNLINQQKAKMLQEKTDQIFEMASVMQNSIQLDEASAARDQEVKSRLVTENKGLRELLEISRKNGSNVQPVAAEVKKSISRECQTDDTLLNLTSTSDEVAASSRDHPTSKSSNSSLLNPSSSNASGTVANGPATQPSSKLSPVRASLVTNSISPCFNDLDHDLDDVEDDEEEEDDLALNGSLSSSTGTVHQLGIHGSESSEDDEVTFNTIKRTPTVISSSPKVTTEVTEVEVKVNGNGNHLDLAPEVEERLSGSESEEVILKDKASNSEVIPKNNGDSLPTSDKIEENDALCESKGGKKANRENLSPKPS